MLQKALNIFYAPCMSMGATRSPHTDMATVCKLHTERPHPGFRPGTTNRPTQSSNLFSFPLQILSCFKTCLLSYQELEESEAWIREKSSILGAQGYGKDLSSVLRLLQQHKTLAGELLAHRSLLQVRVFNSAPGKCTAVRVFLQTSQTSVNLCIYIYTFLLVYLKKTHPTSPNRTFGVHVLRMYLLAHIKSYISQQLLYAIG